MRAIIGAATGHECRRNCHRRSRCYILLAFLVSSAPVKKILQASTCIVVFASLLSVIGTTRGNERELLFPIVTHVGRYDSVMFVLNPTEYSVIYRLHGEAPGSGGVTVVNSASPMPPHSMSSFRPDGDINPVEYKGGWGSLKYRFLEVPAADKERVKNLHLLAWTELRLSELSHRPGPINPVTAIASIPAVEGALEFEVPGVFQRDKETAIAILNPSEESIQIDVVLYHYGYPSHEHAISSSHAAPELVPERIDVRRQRRTIGVSPVLGSQAQHSSHSRQCADRRWGIALL